MPSRSIETVEDDTKLVPVTVNVNPAVPANAEFGFKDATVGTGLLTVKIEAAEAPPPGAGLETVTIAVPPVAMSAAVIPACKLVLETNVVVRALPFHCSVEDGTKFVPVTVSVNAAPPAMPEVGFTDAIAGTGLVMVNVSPLDVPPPGAGVETVTVEIPPEAMSAAVIAACKLVPETNVVVRALPFHCTVEEATKLVPVTVSVNAAAPAMVELVFNDVTVGTGLWMVNASPVDVPPPGAGVETVTIAVPPAATSAAVIAACKLVLEMNVVLRAVPFHWTVEEATKLAPVTVSVNAAVPAIEEAGFSEPVASEGVGFD